MKQVSQDEFFAALYADKRDIMPSIVGDIYDPQSGYTKIWKDRSGNVFGKSDNLEYWLA